MIYSQAHTEALHIFFNIAAFVSNVRHETVSYLRRMRRLPARVRGHALGAVAATSNRLITGCF